MSRPALGGVQLPTYAELPLLPGLEIAHSWDVFGPDDELGTLNLLDDATVLAALRAAVTGERVGLTLTMSEIDPPLYGREPLRHTLLQMDRNTWDDRLDAFYPQASSQWDGLRHVRCRELGFYGGVLDSPPEQGSRLGVDHWAERGIVGRGVLLDIDRFLRESDVDYDAMTEVSVGADLLRRVAAFQQVEVRRGDVLCLRFGWVAGYRSLDHAQRLDYAAIPGSPPYAGLAADSGLAAVLWDWQVAAIACDNPAAEVSPGDPAVGSLHRRLQPALGLAVGELFDFEQLASRCAADQRWTFLFLAVPLNLAGGVGSPANAVAVR
ncbi:MAG: cyclase family protein [Mycobacteriales bacterium]